MQHVTVTSASASWLSQIQWVIISNADLLVFGAVFLLVGIALGGVACACRKP
jgi:hypothetical protein